MSAQQGRGSGGRQRERAEVPRRGRRRQIRQREASSSLRLSRTPLALPFTSLAALFALPLAWSVLPSASVRRSPVSLPAASFAEPLTLSAVPAMAASPLVVQSRCTFN